MPHYNYSCMNCEEIQEEFHPMSGPSYEITCKKCGSKNMAKTFENSESAPPIFKGEGWETNDGRT
jgi:putative FmdB family regulatory protein